jgi:hypothetical protein
MPGLPLSTLALLALLSSGVGAQDRRDLPANAPENCPYCGGEPARMEPAGVLSHGGFEFARTDTAGVDALVPSIEVYWIETEHFETGYALGRYKPNQAERKKLRAELERLKLVLPEVNPKEKILSAWLRLHLYAQRLEDVWDQFLDVQQKTADQFPDGTTPWVLGQPYWGEGPYLGQKGKYEVLMVPSTAHQVEVIQDQFGLSIETTQKWNVIERDTLILVTNLEENDLRNDEHLHGHLVFNQIHNFIDGYKHYSYDTPIWIKEGLGHYMERLLNPNFNSFSFSEGSVAKIFTKSKWAAEARRLINSNDATRLAVLARKRTFAEFTPADHVTCWSMVAYLVAEHATGFACLNDRLHGLKNQQGIPDGSKMDDRHREAFRECIGMSYAQFDQAWREWAVAR